MLVCVPLPVCHMRNGKLVVQLARDHLVGGLHDQLRLVRRQFAQILIYQRACFLQVPNARINSGGMVSRPMLKCSSERCVCAPQ
jgi:hypothetical protein